MSEYIKKLKLPIGVIGLGKSGDSTLKLLQVCGIDAKSIFTCDTKESTAHFKDPMTLLEQAQPQTLVVSPGVPLAAEWVQHARQLGIHITSDISLAASCLTTEKVIGVTGSVAKSTTVSILGAALAAFSSSYFVGGNLGTPFSVYAAAIVEGVRTPADWIVLELSSYQLENSDLLKLEHSAITFFSPNHLERYQNLQHYYETKWSIVEKTLGRVFINASGGDVVKFAEEKNSSKVYICSKEQKPLESLNLSQAALIGEHNQDNLAVAATIALHCGWPHSAIDAMKKFKGLEHRLENCGVVAGIRYINDSKATSMDSVITAAKGVAETYPDSKTWLLLGGRDKNLPWEQLEILKEFKNLNFIFFGECREIAANKTSLPGQQIATLKEVLQKIPQLLSKGDTVLLSPGGTSLDEFKSFEDRGLFFKKKMSEMFLTA